MIPPEWDEKVRSTIQQFPQSYNHEILGIWEKWLASDPEPPYHFNWLEFSSHYDDVEELYTERRIYLKRVANELRDMEVPLTMWQKVAKALAAVASVFLVIFLALSRVARASD